jgi:hypothetical protein
MIASIAAKNRYPFPLLREHVFLTMLTGALLPHLGPYQGKLTAG